MSAHGVHDPGGNGLPFTEAWAWVTVHSGTEQSITAVVVPGVGNTPLVFQQEHLARRFLPMVQQVATATGKAQRLVHLTQARTVEQVAPAARPRRDDDPVHEQ